MAKASSWEAIPCWHRATSAAEDDVVLPAGQQPIFGNSPCLASAWGQRYFATLYDFYRDTGFNLLEHDGSYPGDACRSTAHPGHRDPFDSRWNQWRTITDFYHWCRGQGIYLNVPDYYYLAGSNKCAMGYRETNWSLPRAQQVIHTRQNIYDGTWEKTPSMGWMFVPLTEYHGGGAAATIEPLDEHLDHYERMLCSNLASAPRPVTAVRGCTIPRGPSDAQPVGELVQAVSRGTGERLDPRSSRRRTRRGLDAARQSARPSSGLRPPSPRRGEGRWEGAFVQPRRETETVHGDKPPSTPPLLPPGEGAPQGG